MTLEQENNLDPLKKKIPVPQKPPVSLTDYARQKLTEQPPPQDNIPQVNIPKVAEGSRPVYQKTPEIRPAATTPTSMVSYAQQQLGLSNENGNKPAQTTPQQPTTQQSIQPKPQGFIDNAVKAATEPVYNFSEGAKKDVAFVKDMMRKAGVDERYINSDAMNAVGGAWEKTGKHLEGFTSPAMLAVAGITGAVSYAFPSVAPWIGAGFRTLMTTEAAKNVKPLWKGIKDYRGEQDPAKRSEKAKALGEGVADVAVPGFMALYEMPTRAKEVVADAKNMFEIGRERARLRQAEAEHAKEVTKKLPELTSKDIVLEPDAVGAYAMPPAPNVRTLKTQANLAEKAKLTDQELVSFIDKNPKASGEKLRQIAEDVDMGRLPESEGIAAIKAAVRQPEAPRVLYQNDKVGVSNDLQELPLVEKEIDRPTMTPEQFKADLVEKFKLPEDQAQAVAEIAAARASTWAKATGKTPEEWYASRLAGIERGGEPGPLEQKLPKGIQVFRGDKSPVDMADYDVGRGLKEGKELGSAFAEGPGIYFTTGESNAGDYGGNITKVELPEGSNFISSEDKKLSRSKIQKILSSAPKDQMETALSNWDENPRRAMEALKDSISKEENAQDQLMAIWADVFSHQNPQEFMDLMKTNGIDGIKVGKLGVDHYVVYNRDLLNTPTNQEVKNKIWEDANDLPFEEGVPSKEKVKAMKEWLVKHSDKYAPDEYVTLYHGTGENVPVLEKGLLPTGANRRRSYQSTSGYVYLAPTPERAKTFGDLGNQSKSKVYAVKVRVKDLQADMDQIRNQRYVGKDVGNTVADSLIYGGSVRVKGSIPYVAIKEYVVPKKKDELFQKEETPVFYSQLQRTIEEKMPNKASPEQIRGLLRDKVKQEEIEWSGLNDFLSDKKSVTKQDVLDHLKQNEVQVQEVVKGPGQEGGSAKFTEHQLPGGEPGSYRELLLTMPKVNEYSYVIDAKPSPNGGYDVTLNDNSVHRFPRATSERQATIFANAYIKERLFGRGTDFKSSHFDEPNILAHVRFNERTIDGKKALFIEEIQSDWHQLGRKKGYLKSADTTGWTAKDSGGGFYKVHRGDGELVTEVRASSPEAAVKEAGIQHGSGSVPDAPFKKTWQDLAFKRMLRYAADNGYEKVAWTTGEQQANRYDLSKQLDRVLYWAMPDGTYGFSAFKKGSTSHIPDIKENYLTASELGDRIGKELAQKIVNKENPTNKVGETQYGEFSGLDLKVGGEGMKGFYDKIIPDMANKYVKKFGGKVQQSHIQTGKDLWDIYAPGKTESYAGPWPTQAEAMANAKPGDIVKSQGRDPIHSIDIPKELSESVKKGQPLFQKGGDVKGSVEFLEDGKAIIKAFEKADVSTAVHELGHVFRRDVEGPDLEAVEKWAGVKEGKWETEHEEKFARGFEQYLKDGKAPNSTLQRVFEQFKQWLTEIYSKIRGLNVKISPEVKNVFDNLLGKDKDHIPSIEKMVGEPSGLPPESKEMSFVGTVREANRSSPELSEGVQGSYDVLPNAVTVKSAREDIIKDPAKVEEEIFGSDMATAHTVAAAQLLMEDYQKAGNHDKAIRIAEAVSKKLVENGQAIQAASLWNRLSPTGITRLAENVLRKVGKELTPEMSKDLSDQAKRLQEMRSQIDKLKAELENLKNQTKTPDVLDKIIEAEKSIKDMSEGKFRDTQVMLRTIADEVPVSFRKKLDTYQTIAQLLNPKTIGRNLLGNFIFGGVDSATQAISAGLDKLVSLYTGQRTVTLPDIGAQYKGFKEGLRQGIKDVRSGVDTSGFSTQYDLEVPGQAGPTGLPRGYTFESKLGRLGEKTLRYALQVPDRAFSTAAIFEDIANQVKLARINNTNFSPEEAMNHAREVAKYRTFQDDTAWSAAFSTIKKGLNKYVRRNDKGKLEIYTKEWGPGNLLLKYPKTPANLLARGIDYSPVSFYRSLKEATAPFIFPKEGKVFRLTKGPSFRYEKREGKNFDQEAFVKHLGRALTGSAIIATGYYLAQSGLITGKAVEDKDMAAIRKDEGIGPYRVNVTGIKRFLETGKPQPLQKGDELVSFDWAQPVAIALAVGANMAQSDQEMLDRIGQVTETAKGGADTLFEQPFVTGLSKPLRRGSFSDAFEATMEGAMSSFVPTIVNQMRQYGDNTARDPYDPSFWKRSVNQVKGKIHVLAAQLPPRRTLWGDVKEQYKDGGNTLLNVFLNPAFVSKYNPSDESSLVLDLFKSTGETKHAPSLPPRKIRYEGFVVEPDGKTLSDMQAYAGQRYREMYRAFIASDRFAALPDTEKADLLSKSVSQIARETKIKFFGDKFTKMAEEKGDEHTKLKVRQDIVDLNETEQADKLYDSLIVMKPEEASDYMKSLMETNPALADKITGLRADQIYRNIMMLPPEQRQEAADKIPDGIEARVLKIKKEEDKKYGPKMFKGIKPRFVAEYLIEKGKDFKTNEERVKWLEDMESKGLVNDNVKLWYNILKKKAPINDLYQDPLSETEEE